MYLFSLKDSACKNTKACRHYLIEYLDRSRNHVYCSTCRVDIPLIENTTPLEPEFLRYFMEKYNIPFDKGVPVGRPAQFDWEGFEIDDEPMTPELELAILCEQEYFDWYEAAKHR